MRSVLLGLLGLEVVAGGLVGLRLVPDTGLYVAGPSWVYPSPLGRLLGAAGGQPGLTWLSSCVVLALGVMAWERRDKAALVLLVVGAWWLLPAAPDAAAGLLAACAARSAGEARFALWLTTLLLHPASALGVLPRTSRQLVGGAVAIATAALFVVLTPYRGLLGGVDLLTARAWGGLAAGLLVGSVLVLAACYRDVVTFALPMVAVGCLEAFAQGHVQLRYMVPALVLVVLSPVRGPRVTLSVRPAGDDRRVSGTLESERPPRSREPFETSDAMTARRGLVES